MADLDADLFRFTTTDLRDLHVAVMAAFEQAAVLAPALNLDQVRSALAGGGWDEPTDDDTLQRALASLVGWGLLEATQDHAARYGTPEEFERKNLQWSLTARGEAAVSGVLHALDSLRHAVGLQTAVLDAIGDGLADLADLVAAPRTAADDAKVHIRVRQVEEHLSALVRSVRQFNGHLQRLLREDATDDAVFADVKGRTVNYLEEYVNGVDRPQRRLASGIERIEAQGLATVFDRALAGANLAPVAGGDPGPAWLAERHRHWLALRAWFTPSGGLAGLATGPGAAGGAVRPAGGGGGSRERPRIEGLLDVARTAIVELLRVLERRWDARRRSASVADDYRALARLFAAAPGEAEAHGLFAAAFGMWPARHAHLAPLDGEARAPATSWLAADPVDVAPALRTTGDLVQRGRARPVADPSFLRAARQRDQAAALGVHDEVRAALVTPGSVRLSHFARLPAGEFRELLALLGTGLDAPLGTDGTRRALSADGRVEVVLRDPGDGRTARLATGEGVLHGPDLQVSITLDGDTAGDVGEDGTREAAGG